MQDARCKAGLKWNTGKLYYSTVELGYQHTLAPSKPGLRYDEFKRNSGRKARRQEKFKNLKSSYPTGGKKARTG